VPLLRQRSSQSLRRSQRTKPKNEKRRAELCPGNCPGLDRFERKCCFRIRSSKRTSWM
jgi:hypothetical protein